MAGTGWEAETRNAQTPGRFQISMHCYLENVLRLPPSCSHCGLLHDVLGPQLSLHVHRFSADPTVHRLDVVKTQMQVCLSLHAPSVTMNDAQNRNREAALAPLSSFFLLILASGRFVWLAQETSEILGDNIKKMLSRSEQLDVVVLKSEELAVESKRCFSSVLDVRVPVWDAFILECMWLKTSVRTRAAPNQDKNLT